MKLSEKKCQLLHTLLSRLNATIGTTTIDSIANKAAVEAHLKKTHLSLSFNEDKGVWEYIDEKGESVDLSGSFSSDKPLFSAISLKDNIYVAVDNAPAISIEYDDEEEKVKIFLNRDTLESLGAEVVWSD